MDKQQINSYFDDPARRAQLVGHISRLVRVRSVREDAQPGMPFGPGPAAALAEGLKLAGELGFAVKNYDNYVGTVDLNDEETVLHILCHLDVVGEGTGWTVTGPYEPKEVDGMLYGRGTDDDKGPACAVLMAMQAVKDLGVPLKKNVRLILGTDEESGSADLAYYYSKEPYAPYTFSPDAEFPLINIEKGSYRPVFTKTWAAEEATPRVKELHGGFRTNVVPPEASCVIAGLSAEAAKPYCDAAAGRTGASYELKEEGDDLHILCHGKGAHASTPAEGNNAITALLDLLCALPLAKVGSTAGLHALNALFPHGDCDGKALGIAQSDDISGPLTLAFSLLEVTPTGLEGQFDSRVPLCADEENCKAVAETSFAKFGMTARGDMQEPHHTPADSPLVKVLLNCYEQYTGNKGECLAIGGGTYVHDIPGGVAFGCAMPGFNGNMHGADEHTCIADQLTAAKIFTQAIIDLCS
ncbi:Sapep family Mn(2+)-dependent dipeptidase [Intestinimonas massiliensis (ex Afouda et al. 2020)]|uniref:Sapep family Mn(2+)-dependent dipeptidase n=1 Tax=Intestinimonas massiliensis (ex Afouda et al. 2020) TaxID=1673721 RepID=UPI0010315A31|nr:Sapep family Mn(2+)-dependent dipeptidase [Intestinimonas massiliensis (ex Afouda et al. 2020)]